MAFLDNSGDIILDAVLTDTGRMRLAQSDGRFRIAKFALSDDEIDYGLYRGSSHPEGAHPSGSAYYDLEIMQTPILEAFTNNTSLMKHKLISMPQTNLLYLPVMKVNNRRGASAPVKFTVNAGVLQPLENASGFLNEDGTENGIQPTKGVFVLAADQSTINNLEQDFGGDPNIIAGIRTEKADKFIRVDQGLDTRAISNQENLASELRETQYIVRADDRLLKLTSTENNTLARSSFVDDDRVASYYFSRSTDSAYIKDMKKPNEDEESKHVISGPKGTMINFSLLASTDISTSSYLFTTLGGGATLTPASGNKYYFIDTNIRISGATTGSSVDVPVRIMKYYV